MRIKINSKTYNFLRVEQHRPRCTTALCWRKHSDALAERELLTM